MEALFPESILPSLKDVAKEQIDSILGTPTVNHMKYHYLASRTRSMTFQPNCSLWRLTDTLPRKHG